MDLCISRLDCLITDVVVADALLERSHQCVVQHQKGMFRKRNQVILMLICCLLMMSVILTPIFRLITLIMPR